MNRLTFINHASVLIETDKTVLVMDPWVEGTAFNNGWALLDQSTSNDKLYSTLRTSGKNIVIWYSHEHSDHFTVSFVRGLASSGLGDVTFLFHRTLDKRVVIFLRRQGFDARECDRGEEVGLDDELSITTFPHRESGDSYALVKIGDKALLNLNDCRVNTSERCIPVWNEVHRLTPSVDLLLTQFGYANWIGNEEDFAERQEAAKEQRRRIQLQADYFMPRYIIPFASFVYFCHEENRYLNDAQNSLRDVLEDDLLTDHRERFIFMKPSDTIDLGDLGKTAARSGTNAEAITHWEGLARGPKDMIKPGPSVPLESLSLLANAYRRRANRALAMLPYLFELARIIRPLRIKLMYSGEMLRLSYITGLSVENTTEFDCSCSSETLSFILKNDFGFNTTAVNGRFRASGDVGLRTLNRFFAPQSFVKDGYGWRSPLLSARRLLKNLRAIARFE